MANGKGRKVLWLSLITILLIAISSGIFLFFSNSDSTKETVVSEKVEKLEDPVYSEDELKDTVDSLLKSISNNIYFYFFQRYSIPIGLDGLFSSFCVP